MSRADAWSPDQYERFRAERAAPFEDLLASVEARAGMRVVDLGCGTGELTEALAARLPGATVVGLDSSPAMLERAHPRARPGLSFRLRRIEDALDASEWDLVFSHAALHWVEDHEDAFSRLLATLPEGGQVAIQMPRNFDAPSHVALAALLEEPHWSARFSGARSKRHVLPLERYAELFHAHGLRAHSCVEKVYGHELRASEDVVEWVKGTALTPWLVRLDAGEGARFVAEYRERLLAAIGVASPYFFPFRRVLLWGRKG